MGSVGAPEIMLILLVGLFVLGPSKLPDAARQAARALAEFKKFSQGLQQELKAEMRSVTDPPPASSTPAANGAAAQPSAAAPRDGAAPAAPPEA